MSRPDAEIIEVGSLGFGENKIEKKLKIVIDAKFYTSQL